LIHLFLSPLAMLKSGFILSFGATAGIIFLYNPLQRLFKLESFISKRTDVGFVSFIKRRIPQLIASSLLITAAAQLAILPAIVHFFGAQSVWSFLVNLLAAPLAMCGYIISITATLLNFAPLAVAGDFIFTLLTFWVRICSSLPMATLRIARFPLWLTLICILICLLSSDLSIIKQKFRSFMPLFILVAALISNLIAALSLNGCSIVFLDAGQADCAVIRTEGRVYLIDTGDSYTPAADYLSAMNYAPDAVFLSHPHTDHAGGLNNILDVCTPGIIYTSPNWHLYDIDESISESLLRAQAQGSQIVCISEGESIHLSDKTLLQVLSPSAGFSANSANDDSLILLLEHGNASALFLGDAQTSVSIDHLSDIDVLKVAHHGATDGLNAQFLARTTPSVAFIPVGYNNYGHPAGKTLDLLKSSGARVYRSDMHGAVTCRLDPDGSITVQPYFSSEDIHGLE